MSYVPPPWLNVVALNLTLIATLLELLFNGELNVAWKHGVFNLSEIIPVVTVPVSPVVTILPATSGSA